MQLHATSRALPLLCTAAVDIELICCTIKLLIGLLQGDNELEEELLDRCCFGPVWG